ncbi:MAG: PQQ-like beta-propeller repeat protein [Verrucomicrobia bacterium]|nr:PQQ-like beta-propeller repeat protein [Verrucomicrobiota bacterium]
MRAPRISLIAFGLILCVLSNSIPASAAHSDQYNRNWPQWRGPAGNGLVLHGDPPLRWSEENHVKWKAQVAGKGHATPIVWENNVFLLTAVPSGSGGKQLSFTVLCLDKQTGKTLWKKVAREHTPHQEIQPTNSHSSGSPVTDGEHLVVSFGSFGLYCYDLEGNQIWRKDLGKVNVTWGEGSSPAIVGDAVIVVQDNNGESYVYAFDKQTGKELWKQRRDEGSSWTTPFVLERDGKTQVIINGAKAVRSYDPASGNVLWQCSGLGINVVPMVVVDQNTVFAMSGQRTSPMAMAIKLGGSGDLTGTDAVLWKFSRGTSYVSSPLLYDGFLYFFQHINAILTCLDATTGQPHFAQERLEGITSVYASPIGVHDRIYVAGREGTTVVLQKSKELKILARNKLEDGFEASPAVVGNELFLRGRSHLYCIAEK